MQTDLAQFREVGSTQAAKLGSMVGLKTDFKVKNLIGRSSGESIQMAFTGQGCRSPGRYFTN